MPGPPPPPPPGPPPMSMKLPTGGGGPDDRSALLKSIQKGAKLKKTVTNDKSAPMIGGKSSVSNNNGSNRGASNFGSSSSASSNPAPVNGLNLGEIFAKGRPKLKATGKLDLPSANNNNEYNGRKPQVSPQPARNISNDWKRQISDNKPNRGPPPPAPVRITPDEDRHQSPLSHTKSNGDFAFPRVQQQNSALHRKVRSNTNLNAFDSTDSINGYNQSSNKPVISHGKPNLAPKPPALNGKPMAPPKKLITNGKPVSRAQSMKSPRSPSPQSPEAAKFGTVRNLASVLGSSLTHSTGSLSPKPRPLLNGRPNIPPPCVPSQQPPVPPHGSLPLPPSKTGSVKPPSHAPPPPPTMLPQPPNHTPPPPPHRTAPTRAPPAVPQAAAPPPPPRHSSMTSNRKPVADFDERFRKMFNDPTTFPKPPPYKNVFKNYGNRAGSKQQAPQPPNFQSSSRPWDTTSAC